jgi:hypothetical protein
MVTCENGHENPTTHHFCGECGTPLSFAQAVCAHGHRNPDDQKFCAECGAPLVAPIAAASAASPGRWTVDPTGRHQYRFSDGSTLTEHVADNGKFSTDPLPATTSLYPEKWIGVLAALVTVVLIAGAISAIATQFSGKDDPSPVATAQSEPPRQLPDAAPPPVPRTSQGPATPAAARLIAVIGSKCLPKSTNGVTADGSVAYCGRWQNSSTYIWSLFPGDIPLPDAPGVDASGQDDPSVVVCMSQTARTKQQCDTYLQRPSDPGDGLG